MALPRGGRVSRRGGSPAHMIAPAPGDAARRRPPPPRSVPTSVQSADLSTKSSDLYAPVARGAVVVASEADGIASDEMGRSIVIWFDHGFLDLGHPSRRITLHGNIAPRVSIRVQRLGQPIGTPEYQPTAPVETSLASSGAIAGFRRPAIEDGPPRNHATGPRRVLERSTDQVAATNRGPPGGEDFRCAC